ncbi:MAG: hypothetical protein ACRD92_00860 [Nitrosopumilaceae archaeon]
MDRTREIVRYLMLDDEVDIDIRWLEDDLLFEIIKKYKCDRDYAHAIFSNMEHLGIDLCKDFLDMKFKYDILRFAEMRGFLSKKEILQVLKRIGDKLEEERRIESEEKEREKIFIQKYGDMSKWSDEIWKEYESE